MQDKAPYRDDMSGSDDEDDHDAYLERMKAEGKDRQSGDEDDDSDSSGGSPERYSKSSGRYTPDRYIDSIGRFTQIGIVTA